MHPFVNQLASKETLELMARFLNAANVAVKKQNYNPDVLEAFDLIQAISCYRYFPTVDQCIEAFPNLTCDRNKVEYIWEQFSKLTGEQISNVFISSLNKLDLSDEIIS